MKASKTSPVSQNVSSRYRWRNNFTTNFSLQDTIKNGKNADAVTSLFVDFLLFL